MGATFVARRAQGTKEEVRKLFEEWQDDDRHQNGHSYSGGWGEARGLEFEDKTFLLQEDAEKYLDENAEKYGPAIAVRVAAEPQGLAVVEHLREQRNEVQKKIWNLPTFVVKRVKEGASKYRTCDGCGSKLAVKYLASVDCPLCRTNFLYTEADKKQLASWQERAKSLDESIKEARRKAAAGQPMEWLLGACVAC